STPDDADAPRCRNGAQARTRLRPSSPLPLPSLIQRLPPGASVQNKGSTLTDVPRTPAQQVKNLASRIFGTSPARISITLFFLVIMICTALLMLPISHQSGHPPTVSQTLFTATSAVTVTGLTTVSTAAQWSLFGQIVILLGIQIGG